MSGHIQCSVGSAFCTGTVKIICEGKPMLSQSEANGGRIICFGCWSVLFADPEDAKEQQK